MQVSAVKFDFIVSVIIEYYSFILRYETRRVRAKSPRILSDVSTQQQWLLLSH
jgi:hypothetical protein